MSEPRQIDTAVLEHISKQEQEFQEMRRQVAEMHAMFSQFAAVMTQMQSHPMLSAFMPRGL